MNLSSMLNTRTKLQKPVRVGLIGAGKFGSMILSQARHIEGLIISAVADLDVKKAKESATYKDKVLNRKGGKDNKARKQETLTEKT